MNKFRLVYGYIAYYMHLDNPRVVRMLRYAYKDKPLVYIFRNNVNNKLYVGSTTIPTLRFHNHLVTGTNSNAALQADIKLHGLENFTAYIMELVEFPIAMTDVKSKTAYLHSREQFYMDRFSADQLYNDRGSSQRPSQ